MPSWKCYGKQVCYGNKYSFTLKESKNSKGHQVTTRSMTIVHMKEEFGRKRNRVLKSKLIRIIVICVFRAACSLHHDNGFLATDDLNTNSQLHAARFRVAKKILCHYKMKEHNTCKRTMWSQGIHRILKS